MTADQLGQLRQLYGPSDADLIPREIDRTKLPKSALNILHKFDPYIDFMNQQAIKPPCLKIFKKTMSF